MTYDLRIIIMVFADSEHIHVVNFGPDGRPGENGLVDFRPKKMI